MSLTVLIPTSGQKDTLPESLNGFLETPSARVSLSTEHDLSFTNDRIQVTKTSRGLWLSQRLNDLLEHVETEFVMCSDDDMVVRPGALDRMMAVLRAYPDDRLILAEGYVQDNDGPCVGVIEVPRFWMMRTTNFKEIGGLDPTYRYGCMEIDLLERVWSRKGTAVLVEGACLHHRLIPTKSQVLLDEREKDFEAFRKRWGHERIMTAFQDGAIQPMVHSFQCTFHTVQKEAVTV